MSKTLLFKLAGDDLAAGLGFLPELSILKSPSPNAFALQPNRVVVSLGLCEEVQNEGELAFVLAHELGHISLGHQHKLSSFMAAHRLDTTLSDELAADRFAVGMLKNAGLDPASGAALLARLLDDGARQGIEMERIYPTLAARLSALSTN